MSGDLAPLPNDAIRARRCWQWILGVWAWEALLGAALAWPFASIARSAYGAHPRGDAVLWDDGALPLLDLVLRRRPALGALIAHGVTVTLFAAALGLVLSAALLAGLAFTMRDRRALSSLAAVQAAMAAFVPFAILLAVTLAFQGSLVLSAVTLARLASEGFAPTLGSMKADLVGLLLLGLGLLLVACAGVTQDLARAAVVRFGAGAGGALRLAVRTVTPRVLALSWSWGWRALASVVPVAFGAFVAERIGGRGGKALAALFAVHQAVIGTRVALRASWLAKAMRVVDQVGRGSA